VSTPDKPDTARGWRFVEKLLADDDIDGLDKASDEEVERQMDEQGVDASGVASADELLAKVTERASQRQRDQAERPPATVHRLRRVRTIAWLAAAAIGVMAVVLAVERQELIALFRREPVAPLPTQPPTPPTPPDLQLTRQERAAALRREAYPACGHAAWTLCERKLNEAQALDPEGEYQEAVRVARDEITIARHPDASLFPPDVKWAPDAGRR
jgi:hypothetical protein